MKAEFKSKFNRPQIVSNQQNNLNNNKEDAINSTNDLRALDCNSKNKIITTDSHNLMYCIIIYSLGRTYLVQTFKYSIISHLKSQNIKERKP